MLKIQRAELARHTKELNMGRQSADLLKKLVGIKSSGTIAKRSRRAKACKGLIT